MTPEADPLPTLAPLNIACTTTDCDNNLHCFRRSRKKKKVQGGLSGGTSGACQACGEERVDWARVHQKNIADIGYTVDSLRFEWIRNHFWDAPLTEHAVNYARRKGRVKLQDTVSKRVVAAVGGASATLYRDGMQTPTKDLVNPIHAAQHAMAVCCRKCIEYWHGIPQDRDLSAQETKYLTQLLVHYLDRKLPDLLDSPQKVASIPKGHRLSGSKRQREE